MRIAWPVRQGRISPVFDTAGALLVIEQDGGASSTGPRCPQVTCRRRSASAG